jgi:hypothetical protein
MLLVGDSVGMCTRGSRIAKAYVGGDDQRPEEIKLVMRISPRGKLSVKI